MYTGIKSFGDLVTIKEAKEARPPAHLSIQMICRLDPFSYQSLVSTLSLLVLIRHKRAGRPASVADYYVVEVSTGEVKK